jgi:hypothetical protein
MYECRKPKWSGRSKDGGVQAALQPGACAAEGPVPRLAAEEPTGGAGDTAEEGQESMPRFRCLVEVFDGGGYEEVWYVVSAADKDKAADVAMQEVADAQSILEVEDI